MLYAIETRLQVEVNTDPQRRCYNGCNFSSKVVWTAWEVLHSEVPKNEVERKLKFWRGLNSYAVSQRGKIGTLREYRAVIWKPGTDGTLLEHVGR